MNRKSFKSHLFKRIIKTEDLDFWFYLYSEALYRLKLNNGLNCPCSECWVERSKLNHLLDQIEEASYIHSVRRKSKLTGKGDCGRRLGPVA